MRLEVQFGQESGFDPPIRQTLRWRARWLKPIGMLLGKLASVGRLKPLKPERAGGNYPKGSNP